MPSSLSLMIIELELRSSFGKEFTDDLGLCRPSEDAKAVVNLHYELSPQLQEGVLNFCLKMACILNEHLREADLVVSSPVPTPLPPFHPNHKGCACPETNKSVSHLQSVWCVTSLHACLMGSCNLNCKTV